MYQMQRTMKIREIPYELDWEIIKAHGAAIFKKDDESLHLHSLTNRDFL